MGRNGSKTRKLRMKQGCRDLVAINCRLRGLAADFCKKQKIVLAKSVKVMVGSEKDQGWVWVEKT